MQMTGSRESLDSLLQKSVQYCPQAEVLWLMGAKEKWLAGDTKGARQILAEANKTIADSEAIWLAAVKLERETNNFERARLILQKGRELAPSAKIWKESARLEWLMNNRYRRRSC